MNTSRHDTLRAYVVRAGLEYRPIHGTYLGPPSDHTRTIPNTARGIPIDGLDIFEERAVDPSRQGGSVALRHRSIFPLTLSMHGVHTRTRATTRIKRFVHRQRVGNHAPGFGDRNTSVVLEANGATTTVSAHQTMLLTEATNACPFPVLTGVGPLDDDDPSMTNRFLRNNFKVLPQFTGNGLMTP